MESNWQDQEREFERDRAAGELIEADSMGEVIRDLTRPEGDTPETMRDEALYGFSVVDEHGDRVDPRSLVNEVRLVALPLCARCLAGFGGECHTPGCALWMNRAPDVPLTAVLDHEALIEAAALGIAGGDDWPHGTPRPTDRERTYAERVLRAVGLIA